jgi:hypothetical protein
VVGLLAGAEVDAWASESTAVVAGFRVLSLCVDKNIVSVRLKTAAKARR